MPVGRSLLEVYLSWANSVLADEGFYISSVTELQDGRLFSYLVNALCSGANLKVGTNLPPSANVDSFLAFLSNAGVPCHVTASGILTGSLKCILDVLWMIMLHFCIHKIDIDPSQRTISNGKNKMLDWCGSKLNDSSFGRHKSFVDSLCCDGALVRLISGVCDVEQHEDHLIWLTNALISAEKQLAISKDIIRATDVIEDSVDENNLLIYLALLRRKDSLVSMPVFSQSASEPYSSPVKLLMEQQLESQLAIQELQNQLRSFNLFRIEAFRSMHNQSVVKDQHNSVNESGYSTVQRSPKNNESCPPFKVSKPTADDLIDSPSETPLVDLMVNFFEKSVGSSFANSSSNVVSAHSSVHSTPEPHNSPNKDDDLLLALEKINSKTLDLKLELESTKARELKLIQELKTASQKLYTGAETTARSNACIEQLEAENSKMRQELLQAYSVKQSLEVCQKGVQEELTNCRNRDNISKQNVPKTQTCRQTDYISFGTEMEQSEVTMRESGCQTESEPTLTNLTNGMKLSPNKQSLLETTIRNHGLHKVTDVTSLQQSLASCIFENELLQSKFTRANKDFVQRITEMHTMLETCQEECAKTALEKKALQRKCAELRRVGERSNGGSEEKAQDLGHPVMSSSPTNPIKFTGIRGTEGHTSLGSNHQLISPIVTSSSSRPTGCVEPSVATRTHPVVDSSASVVLSKVRSNNVIHTLSPTNVRYPHRISKATAASRPAFDGQAYTQRNSDRNTLTTSSDNNTAKDDQTWKPNDNGGGELGSGSGTPTLPLKDVYKRQLDYLKRKFEIESKKPIEYYNDSEIDENDNFKEMEISRRRPLRDHYLPLPSDSCNTSDSESQRGQTSAPLHSFGPSGENDYLKEPTLRLDDLYKDNAIDKPLRIGDLGSGTPSSNNTSQQSNITRNVGYQSTVNKYVSDYEYDPTLVTDTTHNGLSKYLIQRSDDELWYVPGHKNERVDFRSEITRNTRDISGITSRNDFDVTMNGESVNRNYGLDGHSKPSYIYDGVVSQTRLSSVERKSPPSYAQYSRLNQSRISSVSLGKNLQSSVSPIDSPSSKYSTVQKSGMYSRLSDHNRNSIGSPTTTHSPEERSRVIRNLSSEFDDLNHRKSSGSPSYSSSFSGIKSHETQATSQDKAWNDHQTRYQFSEDQVSESQQYLSPSNDWHDVHTSHDHYHSHHASGDTFSSNLGSSEIIPDYTNNHFSSRYMAHRQPYTGEDIVCLPEPTRRPRTSSSVTTEDGFPICGSALQHYPSRDDLFNLIAGKI